MLIGTPVFVAGSADLQLASRVEVLSRSMPLPVRLGPAPADGARQVESGSWPVHQMASGSHPGLSPCDSSMKAPAPECPPHRLAHSLAAGLSPRRPFPGLYVCVCEHVLSPPRLCSSRPRAMLSATLLLPPPNGFPGR